MIILNEEKIPIAQLTDITLSETISNVCRSPTLTTILIDINLQNVSHLHVLETHMKCKIFTTKKIIWFIVLYFKVTCHRTNDVNWPWCLWICIAMCHLLLTKIRLSQLTEFNSFSARCFHLVFEIVAGSLQVTPTYFGPCGGEFWN